MKHAILTAGILGIAALYVSDAQASERRDRPRYETPYSNAAVAREREARRIERELDRDRAERSRRETDRRRLEDRRRY